MPRLQYVKLSNDGRVIGPIPASTITQKLSSQQITGVSVSGDFGSLMFSLTVTDGSYIHIQPKADGATIGLIEIKY